MADIVQIRPLPVIHVHYDDEGWNVRMGRCTRFSGSDGSPATSSTCCCNRTGPWWRFTGNCRMSRWRKLRKAHPAHFPFCEGCEATGKPYVLANTVDHVHPISDGGPAFPGHEGL